MSINSTPKKVIARFLRNKQAEPFIAKVVAMYPSFTYEMCRAIASVIFYRRTTSYKRYYAPFEWRKEAEEKVIQLGDYEMWNKKWYEIPIDLKSLQSIKVETIMKHVDIIKETYDNKS